MENNEDFWFRYNDGSGWQTVASWARGTNFNNNTFYTTTVTLDAASYNLTSNGQFRFQCDASANSDHIYIDALTITQLELYDVTGAVVLRKQVGLESTSLDLSDLAAGVYMLTIRGEEDEVLHEKIIKQ